MSPAPARSTTASSSPCSPARAMTAGSGVSTSQQQRPRLGWAGLPPTARAQLELPIKKESRIMKVGFIGLGIMGKPMALNLRKGGHELFAQTRSGVPQDLLDAGAT